MLTKLAERKGDFFYFLFRVLVGLNFAQHGAQKLLGWFTDRPPVTLPSQMGLAGLIELVGGLAITLGLGARVIALIGALEMLYAYFTVHFRREWVPIQNGGELALLYLAAFLVILRYGSGKWSLGKGG